MAVQIGGAYVKLGADIVELKRGLKKANDKISKYGKNTRAQNKKIQKSFDAARKGAQRLGQAFAVLASAAVFGKFIMEANKSADAMKLLDARMTRFAGTADAFARTIRIAQELGVSIDDAGAGMTRLLIATKTMGTPLATIERMQKNLVLLGRAGGSAPEEMANSIRQLGQGLAAGALRGDELRSVMEGMPLVAQEIARELGKDIGQLRAMGAEGKITSGVVIKALEDIGTLGDAVPETFGQAFTRVQNEWDLLMAHMGRQLEASGAMRFMEGLLLDIRRSAGDYSDLTREELQLNAGALLMVEIPKAKAELDALKEKMQGFGYVSETAYMAAVKNLSEQREKYRLINAELDKLIAKQIAVDKVTVDPLALIQVTAKRISLSEQVGPTRPGGGSGNVSAFNIPDPGGISEGMKERIRLIQKEMDVLRMSAREQFIYNGLVEAGTNLRDEDAAALREQLGAQFDLTESMKEASKEMNVFAEQAARNIQSSFADFLFDPMEDGFDGLVRSFAETLRRMAAEAAASWILSQLFGGTSLGKFFPGKAAGGPVTGGSPYIVGERGPELFVPSKSGTIIPNGKLGGGGASVVMNYEIDARGATQDVIKMLPGILAQNRAAAVSEVRDLVRRGSL